jgi:hypothetical protein
VTVASEPYVGRRFIRAKLLASSALVARIGSRVYYQEAPPSTAYPYVLMTLVDGNDLIVVGNARVWNDQLWQVEVWNRTIDDAVMAQDVALLDSALNNTSGTMTGPAYGSGYVYAVSRERVLELPPEIDGDVQWRRAGGEYRLKTQGA